ncbi:MULTISPECIES: DUF1697 domain-containing protein [Streptomyces]|uniref:DUF1697 domain-containing protein n=1 Tax=Streptomyces albidoflavus TaxID=1886 RepID=A0ABY3H8X6_9ACTN|nr:MULTISPECIES: DUF1697 domain-containing protein [Streptomyces]ALM40497.1 DUF1697 domain-containing protein [Streptomyces sp. FR-008]KAF0792612.1 hypothetical protein P405_09730 [Streptomyces sp. FR-008]QHC16463.1 DUF1697 domain-containing protein [Streptomyces sp. GF20]TWV29107.1 DUF1697 domain-containing protein [Streptomyces albidoflavus]
MTTSQRYAALLRGINVGGHKKVPMAELRTLLTELGHGDARTYLQSGNAVFTSPRADPDALAAGIADALRDRYGFEVGVLVRDHAYLQAVVDACPFPAADLEPKQLHVLYLSRTVTPADLSGLDPAAFHPEDFRPGDRAVYLHTPNGLGRSRLSDPLTRAIPKAAGPATSRNWNTVVRLAEMTAGE